MFKQLTFWVCMVLALPAYATPVPLDTLLERVSLDPAVLAARSLHQADLARQIMRESETGPRAFLGASTGHYRELNSANQIDDYYSRNANIGISYPLLGSLKRQLDALAQAQLDAQRSELEIALRRAEQQLLVRTSYANWWRAQQEIKLCTGIEPRARQAKAQIATRLAAGWSRRSDATALSQRWQALQSRCELARQQQQNERTLLELLAQMPLPNEAHALPPRIYTNIATVDRWQQHLQQHPKVQERQAELNRAEELKSPPWYTSVESSISLGLATEDRSGVSRYGNNIVAAINFSIPLDVATHNRAARSEAVNRWRAARDQLLAEKRRLMMELATTLRAHQRTFITLSDIVKQRVAANLRRNEQRQRLSLDDGDAIEQQQTAELAYFQTEFELLGSVHQLWLEQAALQILIANESDTHTLLGDETLALPFNRTGSASQPIARMRKTALSRSAATNANDWSYGVYIWNSHRLLNAETRTNELEAIKKAGFKRIYVGLDGGQVNSAAQTRRDLQQVVAQSAKQNIQVYLLLGEPLWIEPAHRQGLLDLIKAFAQVPFAGLHLDLEVEQLGWPVPEQRLQHWIDTLAAAKRASPWPLEISSHHRWFGAETPAKICVPCGVGNAGVQGVSLMIYTTNSDRSTLLAADAARAWPKLRIRLAQSVEPELADSESWAHRPNDSLQRALSAWKNTLEPAGLGGIDWQDWHYFRKQGIALERP